MYNYIPGRKQGVNTTAGLHWIMLGSVRCFIIFLMVNSKKQNNNNSTCNYQAWLLLSHSFKAKKKKLLLHMTPVKVLLN